MKDQKTNPNPISKLSNIFLKETNIMNSAIEIEKEKSKAILEAKTHKLQELTKKSDELLNSLIQLEQERFALVSNLIETYRNRIPYKSNGITISNFIMVLQEIQRSTSDIEGNKNIIDDLIIILENFKLSVNELKQEVEINQKLLNRTKNIIANLVDKIEQKDKTYGGNKNKKISSQAILVNQSI
ncbi:MAG: hypothetical protein ACK4UJ_06125 [Leptonema sp. (in: bacteria)]